MPVPVNEFKMALAQKQPQIGCWLGLADGYAAELMGTAGFDWLVIDGEHAPNDLRSMRDQLMSLAASDSHPVLRLPIGETWMVKQALDAGAQTLLIPMVETAEQARAMVAACHYPPNGVRGVGASLARASQFGAIPDYLQTAGDQICLLLQVESKRALENLDEILAVEGVDGVFVGPADLAADMGHLGNAGAPEVQKAIDATLQRITASGRAAGVLSTDLKQVQHYLELGALFVAAGIDVTLLAQAARAVSARVKEML